MNVFGVTLKNHTREEIEAALHLALRQSVFHHVVTINPEYLLLAEKNPRFQACLNRSEFQVADGIGLRIAFALNGESLKARFPGADLIHRIFHIAEEQNLRVFVMVRDDGLSSLNEIIQAVKMDYPRLEIAGVHQMYQDVTLPPAAREAHILMCNFGAPWQEYYLEAVRRNPGKILLGIGVGGAFDFLTGRVRRAPRWMRFLGFEWIFRLMVQPKRLPRILRATLLFPIRLLFARI